MKRVLWLCLMVVICIFCVSCGDSESSSKRSDENEERTEKSKKDKEEPTEKPTDEPKQEVQNLVKLPDVSGTDFDSAKAVLINKGFLIIVDEDYSEIYKKGEVIGTEPAGGTELEENSKVTLLISKGPRYVKCKEATISWYHIDYNYPDEWQFGAPYIEEDILYIYCEPTFGIDFTFKGSGFGDASITDTFDKKAPITILDYKKKALPENKKVSKGETESIILRIPLAQLDSERPTHIVCELCILVGNDEKRINVAFNISW